MFDILRTADWEADKHPVEEEADIRRIAAVEVDIRHAVVEATDTRSGRVADTAGEAAESTATGRTGPEADIVLEAGDLGREADSGDLAAGMSFVSAAEIVEVQDTGKNLDNLVGTGLTAGSECIDSEADSWAETEVVVGRHSGLVAGMKTSLGDEAEEGAEGTGRKWRVGRLTATAMRKAERLVRRGKRDKPAERAWKALLAGC